MGGSEGPGTTHNAAVADPRPKDHGQPAYLSAHGELVWLPMEGTGNSGGAHNTAVANSIPGFRREPTHLPGGPGTTQSAAVAEPDLRAEMNIPICP